MQQVQAVRQQLEFARGYTMRLLQNTPQQLWWWVPDAGISHIAWQVGHLAMAEYRLGLQRIRPRSDSDHELISDDFLAQFSRNTQPDDVEEQSLHELLATLQRVHQQLLGEMEAWTDAELQAPVLVPHSLVKTKLESLQWCVHHEMLHAGQIGLLRRQLGCAPLW